MAGGGPTVDRWWCVMKKENVCPRVNEEALTRVLEHNQGTVTEVILRLAWGMGLGADEMHGLKWADVRFDDRAIVLPDRTIPMDPETELCLRNRYGMAFSKRSEYVLITDLRRVHMHRVYIFKHVRDAFEREGLSGLSLMDLRHDFILRQLEQHNKAYVAKISGIAITSLDATVSKYTGTPAKAAKKARVERASDSGGDALQLSKLFLKEGASPAGVTVWMVWKKKMTIKDIIVLTWEDVDFEAAVIRLPDRQVAVDNTLKGWLQQIYRERKTDDAPNVLLTPKSRKPFDEARLSRVVRSAMVKAGLDQVTLRDLMMRERYEEMDARLLQYVAEKGCVTREAVVSQLQIGKKAVWNQLRRLVEEEKLVRIGTKYYQPERVVPPAQQYKVICSHLGKVGGAYRQELAELLCVESRQCGWILNGFVKEGKLKRTNQWYTLPASETSGSGLA